MFINSVSVGWVVGQPFGECVFFGPLFDDFIDWLLGLFGINTIKAKDLKFFLVFYRLGNVTFVPVFRWKLLN